MSTKPENPEPAPEPATEQNIEADPKGGPQQNGRDARAERLRQIRQALILGGGLTLEGAQDGAGSDPYNSRTGPRGEVWRPRRRG